MKVIVSLSIVMGLAWIGQTIYVIFTDNRVIENIIDCFIACQGIIIFILLVPLSKQVCASTHASLKLFYLILLNFVQVRDAYIKSWKKASNWSKSHIFTTKIIALRDHIPAKITPVSYTIILIILKLSAAKEICREWSVKTL